MAVSFVFLDVKKEEKGRGEENNLGKRYCGAAGIRG